MVGDRGTQRTRGLGAIRASQTCVTSAPLCRQEAGCRGFEIVLFRAAVRVGTVVDAGPGSGWSEVPVCGCEPAALD